METKLIFLSNSFKIFSSRTVGPILALVNGGFLHYTDMKKFLKNLFVSNRWSDFEIILQESGFDISGRPNCPIRAVIATGKLPSPFVSPPGK